MLPPFPPAVRKNNFNLTVIHICTHWQVWVTAPEMLPGKLETCFRENVKRERETSVL
jgi:hypothetical protein